MFTVCGTVECADDAACRLTTIKKTDNHTLGRIRTSEWPHTHALDRMATEVDSVILIQIKNQQNIYIYFLLEQETPGGHGLPIHEISRSYITTDHSR